MVKVRIALANVSNGDSPDHSLAIALETIGHAAEQGAAVICFPESYLPGYRTGSQLKSYDQNYLSQAWSAVDRAARDANIVVILGTERRDDERLLITTRVTNADGSLAGFQDKVQLDPSEDSVYSPGNQRRVFRCGEMVFGIVICHEGWRYPETVRWAVRNGAQVVFHPHTEVVEDSQFRPREFADPENSFHEKAALCRAAENTCFFATVNNALPGACTTSAIIAPDGKLIAYQPYGLHGILVGDIDLDRATRLLANRLRAITTQCD